MIKKMTVSLTPGTWRGSLLEILGTAAAREQLGWVALLKGTTAMEEFDPFLRPFFGLQIQVLSL